VPFVGGVEELRSVGRMCVIRERVTVLTADTSNYFVTDFVSLEPRPMTAPLLRLLWPMKTLSRSFSYFEL